jgi:hypothetical protein
MKGIVVCLLVLACCLAGFSFASPANACPPVAVQSLGVQSFGVQSFGVQSFSFAPAAVQTFSAVPSCHVGVQAQAVVVPQAVHVQQFVPLVTSQAVVVQQNVVAARAVRVLNQRSVTVQRSRTSSGGVLGLGLLR